MFSIKYDAMLLFCLVLLCAASMVILYSAGGENVNILISQGMRMLLAFGIMIVFAQIRPETWFRWSPYIFSAGLIMLLLVLAFGHTGKGAQRWLNLGFFRFQPSELMKLGVPMMVAWVLTRKSLPPSYATLFFALLVLVAPAVLILAQPDLGTTIMIMLSGVVIIFLAGLPWGIIISFCVVGMISMPLAWYWMLHDYQRQRVLTLFDPWAEPLGAGYHIIQSMIAIGSGGAQGKGWLNGSQSQLEFIPERHTDFIFAVLSEEFGFIGVILLLSIYMVLTMRGIYISFYTKNTYCRLLAGSLSMTFFFYVFVNIGMVSGILPVVGVPLPLISFGGTSMVTLMAGFGILMSIHKHRNLMAG